MKYFLHASAIILSISLLAITSEISALINWVNMSPILIFSRAGQVMAWLGLAWLLYLLFQELEAERHRSINLPFIEQGAATLGMLGTVAGLVGLIATKSHQASLISSDLATALLTTLVGGIISFLALAKQHHGHPQ